MHEKEFSEQFTKIEKRAVKVYFADDGESGDLVVN